MAKFDGLTIWTAAFLADTLDLTTEEVGAYSLMIFKAWRAPDCDLPNDDDKLRRIARCSPIRWNVIRATVMEFWTVNEHGRLVQKRLVLERRHLEARRARGRKAARARWGDQGSRLDS